MKPAFVMIPAVMAGLLALASCDVSARWESSNHLAVTTVNGDSRLDWHAGDKRLQLHSQDGQGVQVTLAEPAGLLGLRQGDVIVRIDGDKVISIDALRKYLAATQPAAAQLGVRRDGRVVHVSVPAARYQAILSTDAPAPPQPPAPPAPSDPA